MCFPPPAFVQAARPGLRYAEVERSLEQENVSIVAAATAPLALVLFGALTAAAASPLAQRIEAAGDPWHVRDSIFWTQAGLGAAGILAALWLAFAATQQLRGLLGGEGAEAAAAGGTPRTTLTERIEQAAAGAAAAGGAGASSVRPKKGTALRSGSGSPADGGERGGGAGGGPVGEQGVGGKKANGAE